MSAAVTKVNGCVRISDGLPNLDIYFTLYKYYTIKFFKNQTRADGGHMVALDGVGGFWGIGEKRHGFQTSTKKLHMRMREGGFGASPSATRRQLYHIIKLLSSRKNAQKWAIFL